MEVATGRKVTGMIRSLANAKSLRFECARGVSEDPLVPAFIYESETMF